MALAIRTHFEHVLRALSTPSATEDDEHPILKIALPGFIRLGRQHEHLCGG